MKKLSHEFLRDGDAHKMADLLEKLGGDQRANVRRALKELVGQGAVLRGEIEGYYRISPMFLEKKS